MKCSKCNNTRLMLCESCQGIGCTRCKFLRFLPCDQIHFKRPEDPMAYDKYKDMKHYRKVKEQDDRRAHEQYLKDTGEL